MIKIKSRLATSGFVVVASIGLALSGAAPAYASYSHDNQQQPQRSFYTAQLHPLNDSGVHGQAELKYRTGNNKDVLRVKLSADGLTADKTHPVHIHGNDNPEVAMCPTNEQDTNDDGFVSVVEGAATYGPIKLNLTSPQTPFGAGPTPALFTPFAGTPGPDNAFPMADESGSIFLKEKYVFDQSQAARGALASLMPLENQHIVVHGGNAPASVDADAFAALGAPVTGDMSAEVYDALLPVACGEISTAGNNSWNYDAEEQQSDATDTQKDSEENAQWDWGHQNEQSHAQPTQQSNVSAQGSEHEQTASEQPHHMEHHNNDHKKAMNNQKHQAKHHDTAKNYVSRASWNKQTSHWNGNSYSWLNAKHQYN